MTDEAIINHSSRRSRMLQSMYGLSVILTGIAAFCGGSYALYLVFQSVFIAVLLGSVYALFIMVIDRFIVSSTSIGSALYRIPLALMIGIAIAVPLELRLFQDRIHKEIDQKHTERTWALGDQYKIDVLQRQLRHLEDEKEAALQRMTEQEQRINDERFGFRRRGYDRTGIAGEGPQFEHARREYEIHRAEVERRQNQIENLERELDQRRKELDMRAGEPVFDFLASYEVLHQMKEENAAVFQISWGLKILFILLELLPALLKVFSPASSYNLIAETNEEATANTVSTYIISSANSQMQNIQNNSPITPLPFMWKPPKNKRSNSTNGSVPHKKSGQQLSIF